jgi:AraC family transcriptional regulator, regulatory protein of adaptative response / DNA-3-methyladenine glycosylase II
VATLEALPGIGPWTAQMIALRCCGQVDAFPSGDLGLRRAVGRLVGDAEAVSESEVLRVAEAWRPNRALAAMHLWMAAKGDVLP